MDRSKFFLDITKTVAQKFVNEYVFIDLGYLIQKQVNIKKALMFLSVSDSSSNKKENTSVRYDVMSQILKRSKSKNHN